MSNPYGVNAGAFADFNTETVVVTRRTPGATPGNFTTTTIYSGAADVQSTGGSSYMSPTGAIDIADLDMDLSPVAGVLPPILVGDFVAYNSGTYTIVNVSAWSFPLAHVSALLKRGEIRNKPLK
jgi:hypothetical protein